MYSDLHLNEFERIWLFTAKTCPDFTPLRGFGITYNKLDLVQDIVDIRLEVGLGYDRPGGEIRVVSNGYSRPNSQDWFLEQPIKSVKWALRPSNCLTASRSSAQFRYSSNPCESNESNKGRRGAREANIQDHLCLGNLERRALVLLCTTRRTSNSRNIPQSPTRPGRSSSLEPSTSQL